MSTVNLLRSIDVGAIEPVYRKNTDFILRVWIQDLAALEATFPHGGFPTAFVTREGTLHIRCNIVNTAVVLPAPLAIDIRLPPTFPARDPQVRIINAQTGQALQRGMVPLGGHPAISVNDYTVDLAKVSSDLPLVARGRGVPPLANLLWTVAATVNEALLRSAQPQHHHYHHEYDNNNNGVNNNYAPTAGPRPTVNFGNPYAMVGDNNSNNATAIPPPPPPPHVAPPSSMLPSLPDDGIATASIAALAMSPAAAAAASVIGDPAVSMRKSAFVDPTSGGSDYLSQAGGAVVAGTVVAPATGFQSTPTTFSPTTLLAAAPPQPRATTTTSTTSAVNIDDIFAGSAASVVVAVASRPPPPAPLIASPTTAAVAPLSSNTNAPLSSSSYRAAPVTTTSSVSPSAFASASASSAASTTTTTTTRNLSADIYEACAERVREYLEQREQALKMLGHLQGSQDALGRLSQSLVDKKATLTDALREVTAMQQLCDQVVQAKPVSAIKCLDASDPLSAQGFSLLAEAQACDDVMEALERRLRAPRGRGNNSNSGGGGGGITASVLTNSSFSTFDGNSSYSGGGGSNSSNTNNNHESPVASYLRAVANLARRQFMAKFLLRKVQGKRLASRNLTSLVNRFPQLDPSVIRAVLESNAFDAAATAQKLTEMTKM